MVPRPGPPHIVFATTHGSCAAAMFEMPSCIRLTPVLEDDVTTCFPAAAAPKAMLIPSSSLAVWRKIPLAGGICSTMYSGISLAGVMGYAKKQ